jgi:uncharacterized protein with NRDE domain
MCLVIALSRLFPDVPLLLAGNRDERFARDASPMDSLREGAPRTLGGRDLVAGGTWLAANEHGVVAALTNRPLGGNVDPTKRSRGALPLALTAATTAEEGVAAFVAVHRPEDYNPCWLLVGDRSAMFALDMTDGPSPTVTALPPGIHVLENSPLGGASTKVAHVRRLLDGVVHLGPDAAAERLRAVLADHEPTAPPPVPAADRGDDAAPVRPPALTAVCVHTETYGTRWSGLVTVPADPATRPAFSYTEGPPCRSPFLDAADRWTWDGAGTAGRSA